VRVFLKIGLVFAVVGGVCTGIYAAYWDSLQNSRTAQLDATLFRAVDAGNVTLRVRLLRLARMWMPGVFPIRARYGSLCCG
jgi:hypothetical protein